MSKAGSLKQSISPGIEGRDLALADKPITTKPAETRMGKGKGSLDHWVSVVKPGRILFEIEGVTREMAEEAFRNASHKLPIKTKLVERREF